MKLRNPRIQKGDLVKLVDLPGLPPETRAWVVADHQCLVIRLAGKQGWVPTRQYEVISESR